MNDTLSSEDIMSLKKLAFAGTGFEPFAKIVVRDSILSRLIQVGLVESGRSCRPAVAPIGYRLAAEGWQMARTHWHEAPPTQLAG